MDFAHRKDIPQPFSVNLASAIIHGAGFCLSALGLVLMVLKAASHKNAAMTVGVSLWGAALLYRYLSSILVHALSKTASASVFRAIDHTGEYIAVAAAFAPLCLLPDREFSAYLVFGIMWVVAIYGIIFSSVYFGAFRSLPLVGLIGLAWIFVLVVPLFRAAGIGAFVLLACGWFVYLCGTIFYSQEKSHAAHLAWHSLSLAASVLLFLGTYLALGA